ncbi:MAG: hypothetical protein AAF581_12080, partial [Planctomycetota bacterium]
MTKKNLTMAIVAIVVGALLTFRSQIWAYFVNFGPDSQVPDWLVWAGLVLAAIFVFAQRSKIVEYLKTREMRKLRRSRTAMCALFVCGLYLCVGIGILAFGLINLEETEFRVATNSRPGFFLEDTPEKRLEAAMWYLDAVEKALKRKDPVGEMRGTLPYRELAGSRETLETTVKEAQDIYLDELDPISNLDERPEFAPRIARVEELAASLFVEPSGWSGFVQNFRLVLGTDRQGRSIIMRGLYSTKVAVQMGVVTAIITVIFGSLLGTAAAFFGGIVDWLVIWLYSTLSS